MPMSQEPPAHSHRNPAQNQQLISNNQRSQHHQRNTTQHHSNTGRHTRDDQLERRIEQRRQPEQKQSQANPNNSSQAGQLAAFRAVALLPLGSPKLTVWPVLRPKLSGSVEKVEQVFCVRGHQLAYLFHALDNLFIRGRSALIKENREINQTAAS